LELIPLSKSAESSVRAHQGGGLSIRLTQDRNTAKFVLESAQDCHLTLRETEKENEHNSIHTSHALTYPDPDSVHLAQAPNSISHKG
jgi:hypothetical protein